ncbi:MAG: choice-of-anchor D domain-containing protein [Bryobacteraceae bacterium]|jgi:hypothetical protein
MSARLLRVLLLAASLAPAVYGQFSLFVVNGIAEVAAPAVYNLGSVYPNQAAAARFRLQNTSSAAATVTVLSVAGVGFTLNGPAPPFALGPQATVDFTVTFLAPGAGSYSASLQSGGVSLLLLATVLPALTYGVNTGAGLQPLGTAPVDFGSVQLGSSAVLHFVAVNQMAVVLTVPAISVAASDFALSGVAPSGMLLQPNQSAAFDVRFGPTAAGSRSGSLVIGSQTYALVGTGVQLTYEADSGAGLQPLGAGPVDFGSVELGSSIARHFAVVNQTTVVLTAPAIAVSAGDFALMSGAVPSGQAVQPGQSADFYVQFTPTATGVRTGSLVVGGSTCTLTGTGVAPPPPPPPSLPTPGLSISLPQILSDQQGAVTVTLDATSKTSGNGTLTLDFQPASGLPDDAAIVFASGLRTATFNVSPGDTQGHFGDQLTALFQTGTTAGALTFTATLGGVTAQQDITILPATVGITSVQGVRSATGVEVQVTGFDNTRTAGLLTFTFFDAAGNTVAPGAITADATASFTSYFQSSGLGGVFLLTAVFPVTGDPSQVSAFQAQIADSAGTAQTARTTF